MEPSVRPRGDIAIAVITHNRVHLLQKCVENVLRQTSNSTREIVIWNNGSTDATGEYLSSISDSRIRVIDHDENIGQNGYSRAFSLTTSAYMIELDDDIVEAPQDWDAVLLDAFRRLPGVGFLAADLEDDPNDHAANYRYRIRPHEYVPTERNGVNLLVGPTGGGCAMTARDLYDQVGGFQERKGEVFWLEDAAYVEQIQTLGYEAAILADLKVHHTGGEYYSQMSPAKAAFWSRWEKRNARRAAAKHALLHVPLVRRLNARYGWFTEPA